MIILSTIEVLKVVFGEAMTTSNPVVRFDYEDFNDVASLVNGITVPTSGGAVTNGTTAVTVVGSPTLPARRVNVSIANTDTVTHTITFEIYDGTNTTVLCYKVSVPAKSTLENSGAGWTLFPSASGGGSGTVTSVALALPSSTFVISGSPVTGTGTLTGAFASQSAQTFFRGPTSGGAATPSWGAIVAADLPVATTSALGAVKPDGTTIDVSAGVISVPTATTSSLGLVQPDGTTIDVSAGVISLAIVTPTLGGLGIDAGTASAGQVAVADGSGGFTMSFLSSPSFSLGFVDYTGASSYAMGANDHAVNADTGIAPGAISITLPPPAEAEGQGLYVVKNVNSAADGNYTVTVGGGGASGDGGQGETIVTTNSAIGYYSDGSNWWIAFRYGT